VDFEVGSTGRYYIYDFTNVKTSKWVSSVSRGRAGYRYPVVADSSPDSGDERTVGAANAATTAGVPVPATASRGHHFSYELPDSDSEDGSQSQNLLTAHKSFVRVKCFIALGMIAFLGTWFSIVSLVSSPRYRPTSASYNSSLRPHTLVA
jgi:hypothetical protein